MSTQHEDKIDLDQLEALALKLGGDKWETADDVDGVVFGGDGDSVCACHANAGAMPEFIYPSDRADFIAAADPATVLRLIALARKAQEYDDSKKDAARLMYVMKDIDSFGSVEWDKHQYASHFAEHSGRDEPNEQDKLIGVRAMVDAAIVSAKETTHV